MNEDLKAKFESILHSVAPNYTYIDEYQAIQAMRQAYDMASQERWVSVDRAPEKGKDMYITNHKDEWVSIGYLGIDDQWYNSYDDLCPCFPTHWQPLPQPPVK